MAAHDWEDIAASIDSWLDGVLEAAPGATRGASA
jgi:hypothetical protein